MPIQDQKKAGVLIRGDGNIKEEGDLSLYPKPIFDFAKQREICINGLKGAYSVGLYGNSPKVLDGTWKELFDDEAEGPTEGHQGGAAGSLNNEHAHGTEDLKSDVKSTPSKKRGAQGTIENAFKKAKR